MDAGAALEEALEDALEDAGRRGSVGPGDPVRPADPGPLPTPEAVGAGTVDGARRTVSHSGPGHAPQLTVVPPHAASTTTAAAAAAARTTVPPMPSGHRTRPFRCGCRDERGEEAVVGHGLGVRLDADREGALTARQLDHLADAVGRPRRGHERAEPADALVVVALRGKRGPEQCPGPAAHDRGH